ncbi:MAG: hypothetical protein IT539_03175 [Bradyrhizobiaceae bacterium]|nr:hypothetical protein [Bradyrhizobiaceae bacterium]
MFALDARSERIVAILLAVLMAATRIHHFGIGTVAPDASTAVFFLAGLLLAGPLWFAVLAVEAVVLDAVAIGIVGVAAACMTLGYWLLFVGYLALWYAGRLGRASERLDVATGGKLVVLAALGVAVFFVLSNVGYYFGAGYDESLGAAEYASRVSGYFPMYLVTTLLYAAAGVAVFAIGVRFLSHGRLAAR